MCIRDSVDGAGVRRHRRPRLRGARGRQGGGALGVVPPDHGEAGAVEERRVGRVGGEQRDGPGRGAFRAGTGHGLRTATGIMRPDWRPTDTLLRAALVSLALMLVAVLTG